MRKWLRRFVISLLIPLLLFGSIRLYFRVTDGFSIDNMTSSFSPDPRWEMAPLFPDEQMLVNEILSQHFRYYGKGCQSYVFISEDNKYILKVFKYQRFRPQSWINFFTFIPAIENYQTGKIEKKQKKLEELFQSWKIAFEELKSETGLIYVHLNKSNHLKKPFIFTDKMGFAHRLEFDDVEFLIQHKAQMLCSYIQDLLSHQDLSAGRLLIDRILTTILNEYQRGLADNDHALMQNTGILNGQPIHIDVGQFLRKDNIKDPQVYHQELFTKTDRFHHWLQKKSPELANYLESRLQAIIGEQFATLKPIYKPHGA